MTREDFVDLDAWTRYKFKRESAREHIEHLQMRVKKDINISAGWRIVHGVISIIAFFLMRMSKAPWYVLAASIAMAYSYGFAERYSLK